MSLVRALITQGEVERAEALADTIRHPGQQAEVFALLANALARRGEVERAETLVDTIQHQNHQAKAFFTLVQELAEQDDVDRASRVAGKIALPVFRAEALVSLAEINDVPWEKRRASIDEARQLLRSISSHSRRQNIIRRLVGALLAMDEHDAAETLTLSIAHPEDQATAWAVLARHNSTGKTGRPTARLLHLRNWERTLDTLASTHPHALDIITDEVLADWPSA
jgi:lipopolysaccharide biosynthesis regulator YciM